MCAVDSGVGWWDGRDGPDPFYTRSTTLHVFVGGRLGVLASGNSQQAREGMAGWLIDEWAHLFFFRSRRQPDFYASDWLFGVLVEARPAGVDGVHVAGLQYLSFRFWQPEVPWGFFKILTLF